MDLLCCDITGSRAFKSTADAEARSALQRHRKIEKYLASEKKRSSKIIKTVLLGIKDSGKSTVMKQMHSIYSNGFSEGERHKARPVILKDLLGIFRTLLGNMDTERMSFGTETVKLSADLIGKTDADIIFSGASVDAAICDAMKNVWLDPVMCTAISENRHIFYHDNWLYFYNSTDRITTPEWLPNDQDTLQARLWSRGITEISFNIGPITWEMTKIDNCGAGLRKKGLHLFEDVHCGLYIVPLSDYDQRLIEDDSMTMMHEIIVNFESLIYYNRWFKDRPLVILLNKVDIFKEKLAVSPLSEYFPDFEGSNTDFSAAAGYFANHFRTSAAARASRDRQVYIYFTNATDTASMRATMESIHSSIV